MLDPPSHAGNYGFFEDMDYKRTCVLLAGCLQAGKSRPDGLLY